MVSECYYLVRNGRFNCLPSNSCLVQERATCVWNQATYWEALGDKENQHLGQWKPPPPPKVGGDWNSVNTKVYRGSFETGTQNEAKHHWLKMISRAEADHNPL